MDRQGMDATGSRRLSRATLLKGGVAALALAAGGGIATAASGRRSAARVAAASSADVLMRFTATDGFFRLPGRVDDLYGFGFIEVPVGMSTSDVAAIYKGKVQWPAPILGLNEDESFELRVTNSGLIGRPDLDDSHTVHWHGFRNAIALFDGVPEVSIAVPVNRTFPYYFVPHDAGTYMYHCHFEDTEHVQMGMDGIVFVRPTMGPKFAYNHASTAFDREFTLLLNEVDTRPHDGLLAVQEFVWSDYKPNYWIINGRAYPDTVKAPNDSSLEIDGTVRQPVSSLIQCNPGDTVLLRFVNLGYEQHAMQLDGIRMKVVGEDATLLRGPGGADLSYFTNTIYIGPGEGRDVLFTAPSFVGPGETDANILPANAFNRYYLRNRSYHRQTNDGLPGLGGMVTEVRVYDGALDPQAAANEVQV